MRQYNSSNNSSSNNKKRMTKYTVEEEYAEIEYEFDDDYDYDYDDNASSLPNYSQERFNTKSNKKSRMNPLPLPPQTQPQSQPQPQSQDYYNDYGYGGDDEDDNYKNEFSKQQNKSSRSRMARQPRQQQQNRRQRTKKTPSRNDNGGDGSGIPTWFIDDDREETKAWIEQKQRNEKNDRRKRQEKDGQTTTPTSPFINLLDTVFQVDPEEVKYQADDYNRKLGLDKNQKPTNRSSSGTSRNNQNEPRRMRRKGYAYRYDDYDDDVDDYDDDQNEVRRDMDMNMNSQQRYGRMTEKQLVEEDDESNRRDLNDVRNEIMSSSSSSTDANIIDVEAAPIQNESESESTSKRRSVQQSWKDRSQAYEQVPPKSIKAWGPDGEIDGGIDIRTYSARIAVEEIKKARKLFERKEEFVSIAENDLIQLKRDASSLKKRLLSRSNANRSSSIRDRLRMITFDIENSARRLRRAKGEALAAIDKLEALELRHWALLRQYEADETLMMEEEKDILETQTTEESSNSENGNENMDTKEES
mmetsp:Transcript_26100/g.32193  ORF Transcript_26100/g.32193 Transcript_26100/m.32193 type:complete len:529 (+) Transcript_26100:610-2196(+)